MFGQFRMGQAIGVSQDNRIALIGWKELQTLAEAGIRRIDRRDRDIEIVNRLGRTVRADHIERHVADDHAHPPNRAASGRVVQFRFSPDIYICFLGCILRHGFVAQNPESDRKEPSRRHVIKTRKGIHPPFCDLCEQLLKRCQRHWFRLRQLGDPYQFSEVEVLDESKAGPEYGTTNHPGLLRALRRNMAAELLSPRPVRRGHDRSIH